MSKEVISNTLDFLSTKGKGHDTGELYQIKTAKEKERKERRNREREG